MRGSAFFILDSTHTSSLTLRDYSKVVAGHKLSFSTKNFPEKMPGGSMPSLRARWTTMCLETVFVVAVSLLGSTLLPAQGTGGRILGRVADPSGALIAHVKVVATNEATGVNRGA